MRFGIKRLDPETEENGRRHYHLYDNTSLMILIADQGSPYLVEDRHHVRFARPDGQQVATLDLPGEEEENGRSRDNIRRRNYAIIADHAVYAIINLHEPIKSGDESRPYFTLEVEGEQMLMLEADGRFVVYDTVPDGLSIYDELSAGDLPEPVGVIDHPDGAYAYTVDFLPGQFRQMGLMALALVFLIDQMGANV